MVNPNHLGRHYSYQSVSIVLQKPVDHTTVYHALASLRTRTWQAMQSLLETNQWLSAGGWDIYRSQGRIEVSVSDSRCQLATLWTWWWVLKQMHSRGRTVFAQGNECVSWHPPQPARARGWGFQRLLFRFSLSASRLTLLNFFNMAEIGLSRDVDFRVPHGIFW